MSEENNVTPTGRQVPSSPASSVDHRKPVKGATVDCIGADYSALELRVAGSMVSGCELPTEVAEIRKFIAGWWGYSMPGQGIGNPVHMPWSMFECVEWMARNWHPAPATELAELRAEVERLTKKRDEAIGALEMMRPFYMLLEDSVATLTAQLAAAERERDAYKLQLDRLAAHASAFESEAVKRLSEAVGEVPNA